MNFIFKALNWVGLVCLLLGVLLVGVSIITGGSFEGVLNQPGVSEHLTNASETVNTVTESVRNFLNDSINQLFSGNTQ